jgi:hypothetical protein
MFKVIGGVIVGVFVGAMVLEIIRREKPELVEAIENKAKAVSDKLFENMREAYDFREAERTSLSPGMMPQNAASTKAGG